MPFHAPHLIKDMPRLSKVDEVVGLADDVSEVIEPLKSIGVWSLRIPHRCANSGSDMHWVPCSEPLAVVESVEFGRDITLLLAVDSIPNKTLVLRWCDPFVGHIIDLLREEVARSSWAVWRFKIKRLDELFAAWNQSYAPSALSSPEIIIIENKNNIHIFLFSFFTKKSKFNVDFYKLENITSGGT